MNPDFKELLAEFNAQGVEYLVVGAHALAAHGHVRATKDLDVWIRPELSNAARTHAALEAFGAPLAELTVEDLATPGVMFQIGVEPIRIDILTQIDGVTFDEAWPERMESKFAGEPVGVLSHRHLIQNKKAAGRDQDLLDVKLLESTKAT